MWKKEKLLHGPQVTVQLIHSGALKKDSVKRRKQGISTVKAN